MTVLSSNAYPTLVTILKNGPNSIDGFDYSSGPKVAGDGRIPYDMSFPDTRIPFKIVNTTLRHQLLLSDVDLVKELLSDLL